VWSLSEHGPADEMPMMEQRLMATKHISHKILPSLQRGSRSGDHQHQR
jgi:hypothetical protein